MGATTRTGLITGPLRDRFGFVARLDYYNVDELTLIVSRVAQILGVELDADGASEIASRSRGTPRIANRLLKRVRDYAEVRADGRVTLDTAHDALALFEVDELGLDKVDRAILGALCQTFAGRAVGLGTLAVAVGEAPETVEDVYEPFLLQCGLLERTPRGRMATPSAFAHLGLHGRRLRARLRICSDRRRIRTCRRSGPVRSARSHRARHDRQRQGQRALARRDRAARRRLTKAEDAGEEAVGAMLITGRPACSRVVST